MTKNYTVNAVCIARDASATIEKMLESLKPHVDNIIVVDTGSVDNTLEITRGHGAITYEFAWNDNFADARNFALSKSDADWNIVVDTDEWVANGVELLEKLKSSTPDHTYQIELVNYTSDGQELDRSWLQRVFPKGLSYSGIIHEQVVHNLPVERISVRLGHSGYAADVLEKKKGRNMALLQKALKTDPNDWYLWYQLGKQAINDDAYELAIEAFQNSLNNVPSDSLPHPFIEQVIPASVYAHKMLKQYSDGLNLGMDYLDNCRQGPDTLFAIGDLLIEWASTDLEAAKTLLPFAAEAFDECMKIGDRPDLSGSVNGRGSHLAKHNYDLVEQTIERISNC